MWLCLATKIQSNLNLEDACYHSLQRFVLSLLRTETLKYTKLYFYLLFCMGVKRALSH